MIDHELTDPAGGALTITHDHQGVWITATENRDEVTVGPFPARTLRESFDMSGDLMDGGVTCGQTENEVDGKAMWEKTRTDHLSPERARSLVQERDEVLAYAAETIAEAQAETTAAVTRAEKAEKERDRWRKYRDGQAAENPRPLTAREHLDAAWKAAHVTDGRGVLAGDWFLERFSDGTIVTARATWSGMPSGDVRLVRPPAPSRPAGAEEIEALLRQAWDRTIPFESPTESAWGLADFLAERGVRAGGDR